ncbi:MAG TPA: ATP-binding protein, partial [Ktedonobacterales bacterium]
IRPLNLAPYLARLLPLQQVDGQGHGQEPRDALVWRRLAEAEARYIQELAAHHTLLERHFYLIAPADEAMGHPVGGAASVVGALGGLASALLGWAPLLRSVKRARTRQRRDQELAQARGTLALRTAALTRELERMGLEARRLGGEDLIRVYHQALDMDATRRPLPSAVIASAGLPIHATPTAQAELCVEPDVRSGENGSDVRGVDVRPSFTSVTLLSQQAYPSPEPLSTTPTTVQTTVGDLADLLAPASVSLTSTDVRLDHVYARTLAVVGYPRHVSPGWLERLIDLDLPLDVTLHLHPQPTVPMVRQLSRRLAQLHSSRLLSEQQQRIGRADLGVAYEDVARLRDQLQRGDERLFATSLYFLVRAPAQRSSAELDAGSTLTAERSRALLEERVARVETELENQQLVARPATFEQDLGFLSCLPEGRDRLLRTRLLDTSSLTTAFPFTSNSLSMASGVLLGITATGAPIFIDPFASALENANKVIFAKSGAGKSYACKVETLRLLTRGVDVYVVDPESEYGRLAAAVGGQVVRLAAGAAHHLNPFDLHPPAAPDAEASKRAELAEEAEATGATDDLQRGVEGAPEDAQEVWRELQRDAGDALAEKIQSLHGLLDLMLADRAPTGTVGLTQREKGLLDRALYEVYRHAGVTSDPATHLRPAPLLRDLHAILSSGVCGPDESGLAERLSRYASGSLSRLFAEPTNVELTNRLVVFDVRDMDAELRPLVLYLIAEFVWTRVRRERRPRLLVMDEAWTLMQYTEGGRFLASLARRARKYYLGLVTITQDAQDFLSSEQGRTVLANSSVQFLMKQDSSTIEAVAKAFRLSSSERQYLLGCHKGEGLLFMRGAHVGLRIGA